ncbi:DUF397 domain-containing protein [Streptomyces sp. NPDC053755]|uniref:DUF397 domain-containing protein n=1 Tax=Streptomyces sp. NPDC053755 TaxID=3155815 RepID=UPI0034169135
MNDVDAPNHSTTPWFTSSYSNGSGGECVECAWSNMGALIRDSKRPRGGVIPVGEDAWRSFVEAVVRQRTSSEPML